MSIEPGQSIAHYRIELFHRVLRMARLLLAFTLAALTLEAFLAQGGPSAQEITKLDRDNARMILKATREDLVKYYYDPSFRGLDLEAAFIAADAAITQSSTHAELFTAIAKPLTALDDSHTFFVPPAWAAKLEFGWNIEMIGDACYLMAIRPGSDAEAKGLKKGDRVLSVDGRSPTRANLWNILVTSRLLMPRASSLLVVRSPHGDEREVIARTKVTPTKRVWKASTDLGDLIREIEDQSYLERHRFHEIGTDLLIWKMPQFDLAPEEVGRILKKVAKHRAVILDLRGNPGGAIETLEYMVGGFVGKQVPISDIKSRERMPSVVSRSPSNVFEGTLVVLIDSESASAAELLARVLQLSNRARVIGDQSAGMVMMSRFYQRQVGIKTVMSFGSSITVADLTMPDGKSLEGTGVTPDEILLPTADDLASGRDPVMSHAASLCGVTLDATTAGSLFPIEWAR
jgi:C-terminal processing protease CtpA/Prc